MSEKDKHDKKDKKDKKKKDKSKEDLKVYPIKIDDSKLNNGGDGNNYPLNNPVHLHLLCGRVKSGKSVLLNNLYLSSRFFGDEYKTKILISTTAHNDAVNKFMLEDFDFVFTDYTDDLLNEIMDIIKNDEGEGRFLIIFDDIINSSQNFKRTGKTDLLTQIITTYRHIGNGEFEGKLAIAIAVQYFKYLSPIARNNCSGYYIMGHFPESEVKKMSEALSIFGRDNKGFIKIYNNSRKEAFDFLYLSVEHMEARRNHEHLLWSDKDGFTGECNGEGDEVIDSFEKEDKPL
jgi:hypothetical protein